VDISRREDGEEMTDASDALANNNRLLLLRRHVIVTSSLLLLLWKSFCFIVAICCLGVVPISVHVGQRSTDGDRSAKFCCLMNDVASESKCLSDTLPSTKCHLKLR